MNIEIVDWREKVVDATSLNLVDITSSCSSKQSGREGGVIFRNILFYVNTDSSFLVPIT